MYDTEKLKIGYKADFVIQEHNASHLHWDLRLELPVKSLRDSLTSYHEKRVWNKTTEPKPKFQDKPGLVLRSWAIPKHKLPTDKALLAQETEDHEDSYKNFSGTIPEGYGAGTVEIYDKGKFEIVDMDYDKKYVIKFDGKKVKGYYALIKTEGKKFLWIKVKDTSKYKKSISERIVKSLLTNSECKMTKIVPEGWPSNKAVYVCESCLKGEHDTFGWNHLNVPKNTDENDLSRYGCKNVGKVNGEQVQCACNAAFPELLKAIKKQNKKGNAMDLDSVIESSLEGKQAKAPKGWEGTVKHMKEKNKGKKKVKNPWALAYYEKEHGAEPHYTDTGKKKEKFKA